MITGMQAAMGTYDPSLGSSGSVAKSANFSVGDVVTLNSGGPQMTIIEIRLVSPVQARCSWITNEGVMLSATFPEVCLKTVDKI